MSGLSKTLVRSGYRLAARTLDVLGLKAAIRAHVLPRLLAASRGTEGDDPLAAGRDYVDMELKRLAAHDGPILVGPWLSEVGYEVIYWLPFLRWAIERHGLDPARLIPVTRGGAGIWYQELCGGAPVELFDMVTPEAFSALNEARWKAAGGGQKQAFLDDREQALIDRITKERSLENVAIFHPALMFTLFWPAWNGRASASAILPHLVPAPLPRPPLDPEMAALLPPRYTAVRFYFRPSLPDRPEIRARVTALVHRLAKTEPVVLLNTGLTLDDHGDLSIEGENILTLPILGDPSRNLALQTQVAGNASRFVGTYGGLSYIPALQGVTSLGLHAERGHILAIHQELAENAAALTGGHILNLSLDELDALDSILFGREHPL
ncbi:MAG: hypothetical protein K9H25_01270 [Rhodospirillum sp.]|nr:hypothetical protein [Rhodospirillum sp.]MCF8488075.1 hypothetical protein [Rhodospirillum sp.]